MYKIYMFDGLVLPEYLSQGGSNDIGSGDALTSFNQLPGGGFFDNYGARVSPQNIRPITRNCILWGDTAAELYTNFNALRGKIGKRGKLTVMFDSGELWWQWARLQRVHNPRPLEAKANWLPCTLTFITASQQWYGLIESGDTWEVGDESFYLGDGTAEMGMESHSFDLDFGSGSLETTLTTAGSTYVRNMRIEIALDENIEDITLWFGATGHRLGWENPLIEGGWTLLIDTGEKSCRVRHDTDSKNITGIDNYGARVYVATSTAHGRATGDSVELSGTEDFDGTYHNIVVTGTHEFYYEKLPETELPTTEGSGGVVYYLQDTWANLTVYDRTNWMLLAPGDNVVSLIYVNDGGLGAQVQDYSVNFAWYDHYK
jgi:hypothetical protein